jgi:hypothetical protein
LVIVGVLFGWRVDGVGLAGSKIDILGRRRPGVPDDPLAQVAIIGQEVTQKVG